MEKLLQWAINNTDQEQLREEAEAIKRGEKQPDPSKFDPKIIEAILGKDDATRMKGKRASRMANHTRFPLANMIDRLSWAEAVDCISDPKETVESKVIALDNLELVSHTK